MKVRNKLKILRRRIFKKGFFFTFAAVALSIIIIFSFNAHTKNEMNEGMEAIEARLATMNNLIKDMENDIENVIFISGFRALLSLEDYMMKYGKFMSQDDSPNLATGFKDIFSNGTITTGAKTEAMSLMENNTFFNWTERMKVEANKTGIILDFTINDVTISHSEPWKVDVSVDIGIVADDKKGTAKWTISKVFTRKINITGFVDPLYLVSNNGLVNNTISKTTVPDFSSESNLNTHLINSYYIEHSDAPSYLMRFENSSGSSNNGIESLVNSQKLIDAGLSARGRSAVDFIYFGSQATADCQIEEPEYEWFYLDSDHLAFYNAECSD